jgi:hypothetical protein
VAACRYVSSHHPSISLSYRGLEPQWESVYHLLDLSMTVHWNWESHFGFFPAVLLTLGLYFGSIRDSKSHRRDGAVECSGM